MSEIEKMMQNANVKKKWDSTPYGGVEEYYPPFTAEKQIELIKLLTKKDNIYVIYYPFDNTYNIRYCVTGLYDGSVIGDREVTGVDFEETLAKLINALWQDLTEQDRTEIRSILNGN